MYRDVSRLSSYDGSSLYISGNSLLLSGEGLTLSGLNVFSNYEDHPLWQSSLLINNAYNHLLLADSTSNRQALQILSDASDLLSGSMSSFDYSFYEKKLFSEQLQIVQKLQVLGSISSCLLSPINVRDSLEGLLQRIQSLLLSLQQFESKLYDLLQTVSVDEYNTKDCIQRLMAKNRGVQQKLLQLYDVLTALYSDYDQRVTLVRNDIEICETPQAVYSVFDTEESDIFLSQLEREYEVSLLSLHNDLFVNLCQSDDATLDNREQELQDLLERIGDQSEGDNDAGNQQSEGSQKDSQEASVGGDEQQKEPDYNDVISPETQSYIDQLQNRSEEYQKELEEFLQGSSSSPEIFLQNQYKEFYGEDRDFQERSDQQQKLKEGEW